MSLPVVGLDLYKIASRFWPKVDQSGGPDACWTWLGYIGSRGYGRFHLLGRMDGAHRVAVLLMTGALPGKGFDVDHLCRTTACVNPKHLEVVTHRENNLRGIAGQVNGDRMRAITHCPKGHAYDEENTHIRPTGARRCNACDRDAARLRRQVNPEAHREASRRYRAKTGAA